MRKHIFMLSFAICFIIITLFSNNNYEKKFEGEILFTSERDGNWEIYIMNADGSDIKRLTNNNAMDYSPSWSPDGKIIRQMISFLTGHLFRKPLCLHQREMIVWFFIRLMSVVRS
jgi:hypothetical protein